VDRARDLAESMKVHRMPTADNVVIALLIEPLQPRQSITSVFCDIRSFTHSVTENSDDPNGSLVLCTAVVPRLTY